MKRLFLFVFARGRWTAASPSRGSSTRRGQRRGRDHPGDVRDARRGVPRSARRRVDARFRSTDAGCATGFTAQTLSTNPRLLDGGCACGACQVTGSFACTGQTAIAGGNKCDDPPIAQAASGQCTQAHAQHLEAYPPQATAGTIGCSVANDAGARRHGRQRDHVHPDELHRRFLRRRIRLRDLRRRRRVSCRLHALRARRHGRRSAVRGVRAATRARPERAAAASRASRRATAPTAGSCTRTPSARATSSTTTPTTARCSCSSSRPTRRARSRAR